MLLKKLFILFPLFVYTSPIIALENYDQASYFYGFNWGSLSMICILYQSEDISEDQARRLFNLMKKRIKTKDMPIFYKNKLLSFGQDDWSNKCRKFM